jgi:hypothetical protein
LQHGKELCAGLVLFGPKVYSSLRVTPSFSLKGRGYMVKNLFTLLFASVLACSLSMPVFAQDAPAKAMAAKAGRVEGKVVRSSKDQSTLTVRDKSGFEKTVQYDSSTKWVSQAHGSKTVNDIDVSQVKDGDRVICRGTWDEKGSVLHATTINKRLTGM